MSAAMIAAARIAATSSLLLWKVPTAEGAPRQQTSGTGRSVNVEAFKAILHNLPERETSLSAASLDGDGGNSTARSFRRYAASEDAWIEHEYIVAMDAKCGQQVAGSMNELMAALGSEVRGHFTEAIPGGGWRVKFSPSSEYAKMPMDLLQQIPCLSYVEDVQKFSTQQVESLGPSKLPNGNVMFWGLDRVDQTSTPLDNQFSFDFTGKGVHIYTVDSGLAASHPEFASGSGGSQRAELAFTVQSVQNDAQSSARPDCTGHGTHVAGIAAGLSVGIAKDAQVHGVRVLGCSETSNADVVEALDWVVKNAQKPAVVNMSLGPQPNGNGSYTRVKSIDDAIARVVAAGIPVVVAAGNDNLDACSGSPAGSRGAITVGATALGNGFSGDIKASFSNFGSCLSMFAPGNDIVSSTIDNPGPQGSGSSANSYMLLRGTSQAAPFVTGTIAQLFEQNPKATPQDILNSLTNLATSGGVQGVRTSPNRFLRTPGNGGRSASLLNVPIPNINPNNVIGINNASRDGDGGSFLNSLFGSSGLPWIIVFIVLVILAAGAAFFFKYRRTRAKVGKATNNQSTRQVAQNQPNHESDSSWGNVFGSDRSESPPHYQGEPLPQPQPAPASNSSARQSRLSSMPPPPARPKSVMSRPVSAMNAKQRPVSVMPGQQRQQSGSSQARQGAVTRPQQRQSRMSIAPAAQSNSATSQATPAAVSTAGTPLSRLARASMMASDDGKGAAGFAVTGKPPLLPASAKPSSPPIATKPSLPPAKAQQVVQNSVPPTAVPNPLPSALPATVPQKSTALLQPPTASQHAGIPKMQRLSIGLGQIDAVDLDAILGFSSDMFASSVAPATQPSAAVPPAGSVTSSSAPVNGAPTIYTTQSPPPPTAAAQMVQMPAVAPPPANGSAAPVASSILPQASQVPTPVPQVVTAPSAPSAMASQPPAPEAPQAPPSASSSDPINADFLEIENLLLEYRTMLPQDALSASGSKPQNSS